MRWPSGGNSTSVFDNATPFGQVTKTPEGTHWVALFSATRAFCIVQVEGNALRRCQVVNQISTAQYAWQMRLSFNVFFALDDVTCVELEVSWG